jgi:hypothetical protein
MRKPNNVVRYTSSSEKLISSISVLLMLVVGLRLGEGYLQGNGGERSLMPSADRDKMSKDKCGSATL